MVRMSAIGVRFYFSANFTDYFPMHYPYSVGSVLLELLLYKGRSHF